MVSSNSGTSPSTSAVSPRSAMCRWRSPAAKSTPRRLGLFADFHAVERRARAALDQIGVQIDPHQTMDRLSTGAAQLVQIAAAVNAGAKVLIFDEPTSSLSEGEAERLFSLIEDLRR